MNLTNDTASCLLMRNRAWLTSSVSTESCWPVQGPLGARVLLWHAVQSFADILILSCHWSYAGSRALLRFHHACQTLLAALANLSVVITLCIRDCGEATAIPQEDLLSTFKHWNFWTDFPLLWSRLWAVCAVAVVCNRDLVCVHYLLVPFLVIFQSIQCDL